MALYYQAKIIFLYYSTKFEIFKKYYSLMIRIISKIIAITSNIWISPPAIWNPIKPVNHKINKTITIVVII